MNNYVQMVSSSEIPDGFIAQANFGQTSTGGSGKGGARKKATRKKATRKKGTRKKGTRKGKARTLLQQQSSSKVLNGTGDEESADEYERVRSDCAADLLAQADERCADVYEDGIVEDCVYDICVTGDVEFDRDEHTLEILRLVQGNGVVTQEADEGRCLDHLGRMYASLRHVSINTAHECRQLLQELGNIEGVEGAQLGPNSNCEILFDGDTDASNLLRHQQVLQGAPMWGEEQSGGGGMELVGNASNEPGWQCWKEV